MKKKRKNFPALSEWATGLCRRFREVRQLAGRTQTEIAKAAGLTSATAVSLIEQGRVERINLRYLEAMVRLAVEHERSAAWLLGTAGTADVPDPAQQVLLRLHEMIGQQLRDRGRPVPLGVDEGGRPLMASDVVVAINGREVAEPALEIVDVEQLPPDWQEHYVPIVGRLAAGEGLDTAEAEDTPPGWAWQYVRCESPPANAFAVRVEGRSMRPAYRHGDVVVVDPARHARSGVCVVLIDRDGSRDPRLKRLTVRGGTAELSSLNPEYRTVRVPARAVQAYRIWRHLSAVARRPVEPKGESPCPPPGSTSSSRSS